MKWIDTNEKLPEKSGEFLINFEGATPGSNILWVGYYDLQTKEWFNYDALAIPPTQGTTLINNVKFWSLVMVPFWVSHENKLQIQLKELDILASIIGIEEEIRAKFKGWYIVLLAGFSLAILSKTIILTNDFFIVIIPLFLTFSFWLLEGVYRVAEDRAIKRSATLEGEIKNPERFNSPNIATSLGIENTFSDILRTLWKKRIYGLYLLGIVLSWLLYWVQISGIIVQGK